MHAQTQESNISISIVPASLSGHSRLRNTMVLVVDLLMVLNLVVVVVVVVTEIGD